MKLIKSDVKYYLFTLFLLCALYKTKAQDVQTVYNYCKILKIQHPEIVTAQAVLETGWFKCNNCSLEAGNIFGFYYKGKYINFCGWDESIDYYAWWQQQHYKGGDYYAFLINIKYAAGKNYIVELRKMVTIINRKIVK